MEGGPFGLGWILCSKGEGLVGFWGFGGGLGERGGREVGGGGYKRFFFDYSGVGGGGFGGIWWGGHGWWVCGRWCGGRVGWIEVIACWLGVGGERCWL